MPKRQALPVKDAAHFAQKLADELQMELVDVELVKEPTGRFLRFYIDKEGGVTLEQLEAFHRRLQPLVEAVDYDFMEVSSPGADRPLKTQRDFDRAMGTRVEVKTYRPVYGAKRFAGELAGLEGERILLDADGQRLAFERRDVALVRPLIEFDEDDLAAFFPEGEGAQDG